MIDRWITDDEPSKNFPHYTRANADEVGPSPFSPLGWSLGWVKGCIPGVADGFVEYGILHRDELRETQPEVFGNWGGYFYNQLTMPRLLGVRLPGASPDAMDKAYFGDHPGVPVFVMKPEYEDAELSAKLEQSMAWVMSADNYPLMEEQAEKARAFQAARPDLSNLSDAELVVRAREAAGPMLHATWFPYCIICFASSVGASVIASTLETLGRGEDSMRLISSVGNVESAGASIQLWDLSRIVAASKRLTAAFDAGTAGLLDRLEQDPEAEAGHFLDVFASLMADHGHRGPNEWDMRPDSWETQPELALGMIDTLRHQPDDRSPAGAAARGSAEKDRVAAEVIALLDGNEEAIATLRAAMRSASVFFPLREMGKNVCIRLINEAKLAFFELGRRLVDRDQLDHRQQIFMLLDDELDDFLADPGPWRDKLRDREASFLLLHDLEPPYIVDAADGVPPISEWPKRGSDASDVSTVVAGEVLRGAGGAPGQATGRARVVLDPMESGDLGQGDILVLHSSDPSWTPLYLAVAGVVCDVGAVASHAAIVSRELGVPCAVSVVSATTRIPDGAVITVDGGAGTVVIESLPA